MAFFISFLSPSISGRAGLQFMAIRTDVALCYSAMSGTPFLKIKLVPVALAPHSDQVFLLFLLCLWP
jgi:hypothetical protein